MDTTLGQLVDFATGLGVADMPQAVLDAATQSVVDGVGCAVAGQRSAAALAARDVVVDCAPGPSAGRMINVPGYKQADGAAFVNTAAIRDLDLNDTFGLGHPSDMLGALLAVGGARQVSGQELFLAMVVCYEVWMRFGIVVHRPNRDIDQGLGIGIATAAGLSTLLGLPSEQAANAVAITTANGVPLRASRAGKVSHWKGAATAQAVRTATFSTLLAARGVTGPGQPFEGRHGLWAVLGGQPRQLRAFGTTAEDFLLPQRRLKAWPVAYNMQAAIWAAKQLHGRVDPGDVTRIDIAVDSFAVQISGSEPEKWAPETRETADHSLPYAVARTLLTDGFGLDALEPAAYRDGRARALMAASRVHVDQALDEGWPEHVGARVTVYDGTGGVHEAEVVDPPGHPANPFTDEQLRGKFLRLTEPHLGLERAAGAFETWNGVIDLPTVDRALDATNPLDTDPQAP